MGWITDDGLHEGRLVPEFRDGRRGTGVMGGGVPLNQVIVKADDLAYRPRYATRPGAEVVGWRIVCDGAAADRGMHQATRDHWHSDLLPRVTFRQQEDLDEARLWASDAEVAVLEDREDVGELVRSLWQEQHVRPADALRILKEARVRAALANRDLERAVDSALHVGLNAHEIERASGFYPMVRHQRSLQVASLPRAPGFTAQRSGPQL
ncbi:hypothetical protein SAMN04487968_11737 [Nocardioides terrae]|uniref:Uncharacterized protein n=1 Tax=Nocardioides terrae TaxID=574651 RepID=A0A1I1NI50_9ACTN|nr:hypothetical protein [Nocardioides terrae]SFC97311.1 hypothetical protein SAMN04487968_11737 [Nocardioides terrae]